MGYKNETTDTVCTYVSYLLKCLNRDADIFFIEYGAAPLTSDQAIEAGNAHGMLLSAIEAMEMFQESLQKKDGS